jgi:hypothetical protein
LYNEHQTSRECDMTKNEGESALHILFYLENP